LFLSTTEIVKVGVGDTNQYAITLYLILSDVDRNGVQHTQHQYIRRHFFGDWIDKDMRRRRYLGVLGSVLGSASVAGCAGLVPLGNGNGAPEYPGGTLIIENTGETAVTVSVTVSPDEYDSSLETAVSGGETFTEREFVTAERGDIVTLAALLGDEGDPVEFEFLPASGEGEDTPPEVARFTFENAVEASATWSAIRGK
jgi:hypothetical protein